MSPGAEATTPGAIHVTRQGWMAYALALAVLALDQLSKFWVLGVLKLERVGVRPGWVPPGWQRPRSAVQLLR